jgi:hypothetical protein
VRIGGLLRNYIAGREMDRPGIEQGGRPNPTSTAMPRVALLVCFSVPQLFAELAYDRSA